MSTELEPAIEDNGSDVRRFGWTADDLAACGIEPVAPEDDGPAAKEFISLTKSPATKIARAMVKAAHQQQVERVQRQAARKLSKYFQKSVRHITSRLFTESWEPDPEKAKSQAARLIKGAYDKDAQGDMLVDSASQPVADAFVEGAAAEMRLNAAARRRKAFNPDQPRNPDGTWGSGGSSSDTATDDTAREETDDERHQRQIQSPEFKAWFKDSKVVDDNDDPKVTNKVGRVYHGTGGHFTEFDAGKIGSNGLVAGKGFYFAESSRIARTYAEASGPYGKVLEAYLSIQNPYDFSSLASQSEVDKMRTLASEVASEAGQTFDASDYDKIISDRAEPDGTILRHNIWRAISEAGEGKINIDTNAVIQKAGYDGIVHVSGDSYGTPAHPALGDEKGYGNVWIAFKPAQIKSATDNQGTFDPNDPDITKSVKVTTATQAAARAEEDIDFPTEMPDWLEEAALDFISRTFEEDYWLRIPETTRDDIEYTLEQGIEDGLNIREIARRIQEDHGSAYSKSRATMVARTEIGGAMNSGHVEGIRRAYEGTGVEPAKEWLSVWGATSRDEHTEADGQIVPVGEMFTVGGEQCMFPGDARLSAAMRVNCQCVPAESEIAATGLQVIAATKMLYDGPFVEIKTRSGRIGKATPNHPVLTTKGWVRYGDLQCGDYVIACEVRDESGFVSVHNEQNKPAFVEDVFKTLKSASEVSKLTPRLAFQFHGDAKNGQGEVHVVVADGILPRPARNNTVEHRQERDLVAAAGEVRGSHRGVHVPALRPAKPLRLGVGSQQAQPLQAPLHHRAGHVETLSECHLPHAAQVKASDFSLVNWDSLGTNLAGKVERQRAEVSDAASTQSRLDGMGRDAVLLGNSQNARAFVVFADEIIDRREVAGVPCHVYDLQCQGGWYASDGIIVHNCTIISAFVGEGLSDDEEGTRAFDPSQPRDESGRWAGDGGRGGVSAFQQSDTNASYHEFAGSPSNQMFEHPGVDALMSKEEGDMSAAETEIGNALTSTGGKVCVVTRGDRLLAASSWEDRGEHLYVTHVGSIAKKGGARAMLSPVADAMEHGKPLVFQSTPDAVGFYDKMGFKADDSLGVAFYNTDVKTLRNVADRLMESISGARKAFDPSQPRDDHGRWAADDGGTSIQGGAEPVVADKPAAEEPKPIRPSAAKQDIIARAEKIPFTDEVFGADVDSDDYDAIEEQLTEEEQDEMRAAVDEAEQEYIDRAIEDFESDVSDDDVALEAGYSKGDIRDKVGEIVGDNETLAAIVEEWDGNRGLDGLDDLFSQLQAAEGGVPEDIAEQLNDLRDTASDEIDRARERLEDGARDEAEESARNSWDSTEAQQEWLRNFYNENEDRFGNSDAPKQAWFKDGQGDRSFKFDTSDGRTFEINAVERGRSGMSVSDVSFTDDEGDFSVTGKGKAFEVFGNVVPAVTAYVKNADPDIVTFSAAGKSRQRLYDRLVATVLGVQDGRFAKAYNTGAAKFYIIGKESMRGQIDEMLASRASSMNQEMEDILPRSFATKAADEWVEIKPEVNPEWFKPEAWEDEEDAGDPQPE